MERRLRSNSLGNVRISYIGQNIVPATTDEIQNKRGNSSSIKRFLIDYTANTNLHGLKYIGQKEQSTLEKIFWLLMFACCIIFCSRLIWKLWTKWDNNPVIVSFAETSTPVWKIPYPAVTLCPEMKVMQTKFNYTKYYHSEQAVDAEINSPQDHLFQDSTLNCQKGVESWIKGRKFSHGNQTVENIKKVSPSINDAIHKIMWRDRSCRPEDLFTPILTEEGYCFTFNIIDMKQLFRFENLNTDYNYYDSLNKSQSWTLEKGYLPNTPLETYPFRGAGYGENAGLVLVLVASKYDFDYLCSEASQGFKMILHNPAEFPRLSRQYYRVPLRQNVVASVAPKMMTTSDGLHPYDAVSRQCYYENERYLRFFKVYTQANCETECLTNFTNARCGCVHFGMPHAPEMEICNVGKRNCTKKARMALVTAEVQNNLEDETNDDDKMEEARRLAGNCNCLPSCTSIEYTAEISQSYYNIDALFKASGEQKQNDYFYTQIKIFYNKAQFINMQRSELYGLTDFLANCGGLLGLFLGFSLLSVVEIIYFCTLRVCCSLRRRGENKNTLPPL